MSQRSSARCGSPERSNVSTASVALAVTLTVVKAQVPMAEMLTYEQTLTSSTGGRGTYHMAFSHYEEVPAQLQAKIIAAAKAAKGEAAEEEEE